MVLSVDGMQVEGREEVQTSSYDSLVRDGVVVYGLVGVRVGFSGHLQTHAT